MREELETVLRLARRGDCRLQVRCNGSHRRQRRNIHVNSLIRQLPGSSLYTHLNERIERHELAAHILIR